MSSNTTQGGGSAKSDTSRRPPVVNNPLLSSQVTGLTLDDFAPVAVLLPAAPLSNVVQESTEPTKPVIFSSQPTVSGTVPELPQDTDSFSEIDLNTTADLQSWSRPPTIDYNPLQDLEETDSRGNDGQLGDDGEPSAASYLQQTSTLTAQFAAQLPNVASTVFSTFSRVIKGSSPVPPPSSASYANDPSSYGPYDSQPEFQSASDPYERPPPVSSSLAPLISSPASYPPTIAPPGGHQHSEAQSAAELPPPPPPTFYNPEQVPLASVPPSAGAPGLSNTYRLGGNKKKTYAHIPGLSTTATQPIGGPSAPTSTPFAPSATPAFPPPTAGSVVDPYSAHHPEVNTSEPPVAKGKSSLFGYLPTNILDKLPKPGFGGEKKEEPPQFTGGISNVSIVDQFVDAQPTALAVQSLVPPPSSGVTQPSVTSFFAPPIAGDSVPSAVAGQVQASSPFVTNPLEVQEPAGRQGASFPPVSDPLSNPPAGPPPTFFSPEQIANVNSAPPRAAATRSNPYSSSRLGAGIGRYKNPLAPVVTPVAGPVFLPNQPPPLSAGPVVKSHSGEVTQQVVPSAPPSFFAPQDPLLQQPSIPTIFPTGDVAGIAPTKVEERQQPYAILGESSPSLIPTYTEAPGGIQQPFLPNTTAIFNPLAAENVVPDSTDKPFGTTYVGGPPSSSVFNPFVPQPEHRAAQPESNLNAQQVEQTVQPEPIPDPAPPVIDFNSNPVSVPFGVESVQSKLESFDLGTKSSSVYTAAAPAPEEEFTASFLGTEVPSIGTSKTIVDSRSKSSENVLSPPPRPNSNLSEPGAIFPGSVPPADIFLPELTESSTGAAQELHQKQRVEDQRSAQDGNGNNLTTFFIGNPVESLDSKLNTQPEVPQQSANFFFPSQEQPHLTQKPVFSVPDPTPAINPVDFFNSNTILPAETVVEESIETGQKVSSAVPLFSFFGRTADPAPPVASEVPVGKTPEPSFLEQADVVQNGSKKDDTQPTAGEVAPAASVSNVSSFSNVNDRFEEDGSEQGLPGVGNASNEPIFSSNNLFDFKSSAYQEGGRYSREFGNDTYDGNSSMAAMATTSVGAQDTTGTTNTGTSIAESSTTNIAYRPTYNHWFYRREVEGKSVWSPFTMADSMALEDGLTVHQARTENGPTQDIEPVVVHTDGGRYDVSIAERSRTPVYWKGPANEVRRCSWFYKTVDSRFVPYEEDVADLLEREYKEAATSGEWHRRVTIPNGETVVFHGPSVIVHFLQTQNPEAWDAGSSPVPPTTNRPRVVKRGIDEFNIDDDEPEKIDHLMFMVHGIGEACDLRFRRVEEVVDEFRSISAQLVQSHYRSSFDRGDVGRVEILPISWHDDLHSEESGVDEKLKSITLPSIPKLRHFTNDTLLDVLFYTSPMFCQSIIDAVGKSLNRLYTLFCQRNPSFSGRVSLAGHSLGSLILFDLLCHQKKVEVKPPSEPENSENPDDDSVSPLTPHHAVVKHRPLVRKCSQQINYEVGPAGTGQPYITYPQLMFQPKMFFALGSPIGMFVTIRGIDALGLDFKLPTCDGFFNIFHPYDPVAYRIEALVNPELSSLAPVLIPHHKGRKRMHLELKETVLRVGNDLRQRASDVFRKTLDTVYSLTAMGTRPDPKAIQKEVDMVLQDQLKFEATVDSGSTLSGTSDVDSGETTLPLGQLNQSRRVDYVLQEAPFEFINEYLFALTSHVCYWDSEDTMLFLMKEIYSSLGVQTDHQVPQQSMTIERPLAATSPTAAASSCSLNSNYNLFPHEVPTREVPENRL